MVLSRSIFVYSLVWELIDTESRGMPRALPLKAMMPTPARAKTETEPGSKPMAQQAGNKALYNMPQQSVSAQNQEKWQYFKRSIFFYLT